MVRYVSCSPNASRKKSAVIWLQPAFFFSLFSLCAWEEAVSELSPFFPRSNENKRKPRHLALKFGAPAALPPLHSVRNHRTADDGIQCEWMLCFPGHVNSPVIQRDAQRAALETARCLPSVFGVLKRKSSNENIWQILTKDKGGKHLVFSLYFTKSLLLRVMSL